MANDLVDLMATEILPLALPVLRENSIMAALVNRDLDSKAVDRNETIRVPLPQDMGAADTVIPGTPTTSTDLSDNKVDVKMDQHKYKQFQMSDVEMKDTVVGGVLPSGLEAAIKSLANDVDLSLLAEALNINNFSGTPGSPPNSTADVRASRKILNRNNALMTDRRHVLGVDAEDAIGGIDNLQKANEAGDTQALRDGNIGRLSGVDHFMDQNVGDFTQSTITVLQVTGVNAIGVSTMTVSVGTPATGVMSVGDLFTIAGDDTQYVVTVDETLVAAAGTITFFPALVVATTGAEAITFQRDAAATTYQNNIMFHRDAFLFVQRQLTNGETGQSESSSIAQMTDPVSGVSLRMETWRDSGLFTRMWRLDILYGTKTLRADLAVRTLG